MSDRPRNWGRWGADDQRGTANLITAQSVRRAATAVRSGVTISLAREVDFQAAADNPRPASLAVRTGVRGGDGGSAADTIGVDQHGLTTTHLDALCHVWDSRGIYNGRSPADVVRVDGAQQCDVTAWREGLVTRAVLVDICRFRDADYVDVEHPVTGDELRAAVAATELDLEPGDGLVVYSGRERWDSRHEQRWGAQRQLDGTAPRPGLHFSCVDYFGEVDCGVLAWDMMDALPGESEHAWPVHRVINELGMVVIDNARLGPLADFCAAHGRYEFMLVAAPLVVPGATGSPLNPVAVL